MSALMGLVTLTFDVWTLKLARQSDIRWGTFIPNLGTLGLQFLELFAIYVRDRRTDGRTDQTWSWVGFIHGLGWVGFDIFAYEMGWVRLGLVARN